MPRINIPQKDVPDWTYPEGINGVMMKFEALVEQVRKEAGKCGRNLKAGIRARRVLQKMKQEMIPKLRIAFFVERDRVEALRHGVSVAEWQRQRGERRRETE